MKECWDQVSTKRPSFEQILRDLAGFITTIASNDGRF